MADRAQQSESTTFEVVVDLKDLEKEQGWPNIAAYAFTRCGRFLAKQPLEADTSRPGIGRAHFKIGEK
ncbi:MAG: hypothetical protein V1784_09505, partial [bacterium]